LCRPALQESHAAGGAEVGLETAEEEGGDGGGLSWLTKAAGAPKPSTPAAPGGWMSSGILGISTDNDSDHDNAVNAAPDGSTASTAATRKPRKRKQPGVSVPVANGPGGWLSAGALGVPTEDECGDDDHEGGGGDEKAVVLATIETQTEDDIVAVTERGAVEKDGGRKLPPWAKPWTPPPKPQVVPDPAPAETSAPGGEAKKKVCTCQSGGEFAEL